MSGRCDDVPLGHLRGCGQQATTVRINTHMGRREWTSSTRRGLASLAKHTGQHFSPAVQVLLDGPLPRCYWPSFCQVLAGHGRRSFQPPAHCDPSRPPRKAHALAPQRHRGRRRACPPWPQYRRPRPPRRPPRSGVPQRRDGQCDLQLPIVAERRLCAFPSHLYPSRMRHDAETGLHGTTHLPHMGPVRSAQQQLLRWLTFGWLGPADVQATPKLAQT